VTSFRSRLLKNIPHSTSGTKSSIGSGNLLSAAENLQDEPFSVQPKELRQSPTKAPKVKLDLTALGAYKPITTQQQVSEAYREDPTVMTNRVRSENQVAEDQQKQAELEEEKVINDKLESYKKKYGDSYWGGVQSGVDETSRLIGRGVARGAANLGQGLFSAADLFRRRVLGGEGYTPEEEAINNEFLDKVQENTSAGLKDEFRGVNPVSKAIGSLAEFVPAMLSAEATGGLSFAMNGAGTADKEIREAKKRGVEFKNGADDLYMAGKMVTDYVLMKSLNSHVLFNKLPAAVRDDLAGRATVNAMKSLVDSGEAITAESIASAMKQEAVSIAKKIPEFLNKGAKAYRNTALDLTGLAYVDNELKKKANDVNESEAFAVQSPQQMSDTIGKILTEDAPIFAGFGMRQDVGMLFNKSPYKNMVIEAVKADRSPENVQKVVADIGALGAKQGWRPEDIENTQKQALVVADAVSKLPDQFTPKQFNEGVDLITGRNELQEALDSIKETKTPTDPALGEIKLPEEVALENKIDQANDKLRELATGLKTKYTFDEEKGTYTKQIGKEKPVEITEERYNLEQTEKSKPEAPQEVINTEAGGNTTVREKPDETVPNEVIEEVTPIETPEIIEPPKPVTNEVEQPVSEKANVVKEAVSQERTEEVLKKAEEDLKVLKKVENKTGKADAITKRLLEAKKKGEITENQFEDLNNRVNDVLADSKQVEVPKSYGYEDIDAMANEKEVADTLYREITDPTELSAKEQAIREAGGFTTTADSYSQFGDRNNKNDQMAKSYFKKDGMPLDKIAASLSKEGLEITPADLKDYMEKFPDGNTTYSQRAKALQRKLYDMTGKRFNKFTVQKFRERMEAEAKAKIEADPKLMDANTVEVINSEGITKENVDSFKDKIEFIFDEQTFENIKKYLDGRPTEKSGTTNESTTESVSNSAGSGRVEQQPNEGRGRTEREASLTPEEVTRKKELRNKFAGRFNDITNIVATLADKEFREYAGLVLKEAKGDFKTFAQEMVDNVGEKIREHLPKLYEEISKTLPLKNEANKGRLAEEGVEVKDTKGKARTRDVVEQEASKALEEGYDVPELVDEILNNKRTATDAEVAILSKYLDNQESKIKEYNATLAEDGATMSTKKFNELTEAKSLVLEEFQNVAQAARKTGTDTARALSARRFSLDKEYSLENMITRKRTALGGEKLSTEQLSEVTARFEALEKAQKAYEAKIAKLEEENAKLLATKTVKQTAATRRNRKSITKEQLKTERSKIFSDIRSEFAKIRKSGNLSADVPYRQELMVIAKHMPSILRNLAQEGLVEIKDVIARIHEEFKQDIPDLTERDVTDLIAGVYDEVKPTKQAIINDINSLRTQAKLIRQIEDLENGIAKLPAASKAAKAKNEAVEKLRERLKVLNEELTPSKEEKSLATFKKRVQDQIDKLTKRLTEQDYDKREKPKPLTLDAEALELRRKYDAIKKEFDFEVARDELKRRTKIEKFQDDFLNIASLPRAIKASLDFSAVLRQGLFSTVGHPRQAGEAFVKMFQQAFSEKKYDDWLSDLKHSPFYDLIKESKLYVSDRSDPKILAREEEFTSNLADKLPIVGPAIKASERAYTSYLNVLRTGVFTTEAQKLISRGYTFENNPEQFTALAKVVNVLTGRGDIPEVLGGKQPKVLSSVFFSPRFIAARIQTLYLPFDVRMPKEARLLAAKDIGSTLATATAFLSLAAMAGLKVNMDPRSTNFLKLEDENDNGSTYYDILGGLPRYVSFLAQQVTGKRKPATGNGMIDLTTGKFGKPSRLTEAAKFVRGKLSPAVGSAFNLLDGKDVVGQDYNLWPNVPLEFVPLPFSDLKSAYDVGGITNSLKVLVPSQFGISASSYDPKHKAKAKPISDSERKERLEENRKKAEEARREKD